MTANVDDLQRIIIGEVLSWFILAAAGADCSGRTEGRGSR